MLALVHAHPRDERIVFQDEGHLYIIDGVHRHYKSSTTFIKSFFTPFDADQVIGRMIRFGAFDRKYEGKTPEQVKEEWRLNGEAASNKGSRLHAFIEDFYNGLEREIPGDLRVEVGYFVRFMEDLPPHYTPYRTEWYIFDDEAEIAGSIDMLYHIRGKEVGIYDWKCTKQLKTSNKEKGTGPLTHLDDCNASHYSLQLNLYKYIIEKHYDLRVVEMKLVILHTNNEDYILFPVPDMQREIRSMLKSKNERGRPSLLPAKK